MATAIVRKTFENIEIRFGLDNIMPKLDKFVLKAFNQLSHNQKISGLLVASFLLCLPNYYFPTLVIKTINIVLLKIKFKLIFSGQDFN